MPMQCQPHVKLEKFGLSYVGHPNLADHIQKLVPDEQNLVIDKLKEFIADVEEFGDDREYLKVMQVKGPDEVPTSELKMYFLDTLNWSLCKMMRYCSPSRIGEAVPYLENMVKYYVYKNPPPAKKDVTPILYLAAAISKTPGQEERALAMFRDVEDEGSSEAYRTCLWARAHIARMLRRIGRKDEAEVEESRIRGWILGHPYSMSPSAILETVGGEDSQILDHPSMKKYMNSVHQIGPNVAVHFG